MSKQARKPKNKNPQRTFHTRLEINSSEDSTLLACAEVYSHIERKIFANLQAGKNIKKPAFCQAEGLTSRQYNSCLVQPQALMASQLALRSDYISQTQTQIKSLEHTISTIEGNTHPRWDKVHFKKRKLSSKQLRLSQLLEDQAQGKIRICFGTKDLFHKQFHLADNNYGSHAEWKQDWLQARNHNFYLLGSWEEAGGNQSCTLTENEDQTFNLRLRLPQKLVQAGHPKHLLLQNIVFPKKKNVHSHYDAYASISSALESNLQRDTFSKKEDRILYGQALSFLFHKDDIGWKLQVTLNEKPPEIISRKNLGRLGVDINADHLAVTEIDRFGNLVRTESFPLVTYGKSTEKTLALIGDVAKIIVEWAKAVGKPLVLEDLDFQAKKAQLEQANPARARQLSSLAYAAIRRIIAARAYRTGVEVDYINPAFTSVIGRAKFQIQYGITSHQAAALVIGRRSMRLSERALTSPSITLTEGTKIHGTLTLPVRKMSKHVWSWWGSLSRQFQSVVAPQHRAQTLWRPTRNTSRGGGKLPPSMFLGGIPKRRRQNCSVADGTSTSESLGAG